MWPVLGSSHGDGHSYLPSWGPEETRLPGLCPCCGLSLPRFPDGVSVLGRSTGETANWGVLAGGLRGRRRWIQCKGPRRLAQWSGCPGAHPGVPIRELAGCLAWEGLPPRPPPQPWPGTLAWPGALFPAGPWLSHRLPGESCCRAQQGGGGPPPSPDRAQGLGAPTPRWAGAEGQPWAHRSSSLSPFLGRGCLSPGGCWPAVTSDLHPWGSRDPGGV